MDTSAADSKAAAAQPENGTETPQTGTETPAEASKDAPMETDETAAPADAKAAPAADAKPAATAATKTKVKREELKVDSFITSGVDNKGLNAWFEKEASMAAQDRHIFETNEARNALESYVLEMRNRLSGDLSNFVKESDKTVLTDACNVAEEWVYGDGSEAQKSEYKTRLAELRKQGDAIVQRHYESQNREHHTTLLKAAIGHYQNWTATKEDKYAHITQEERAKLAKECASTDQWLTQQLVAQDKHPQHENPVLTCEHLDAKKLAAPIVNKHKPAPKVASPKKEAKKDAAPAAASKDAEMSSEDAQQTANSENTAPKTDAAAPQSSPSKAAAAGSPSKKAASPKPAAAGDKQMDTSA